MATNGKKPAAGRRRSTRSGNPAKAAKERKAAEEKAKAAEQARAAGGDDSGPATEGGGIDVDGIIHVLIQRDPDTGAEKVDVILEGDVRRAEAPVYLQHAKTRAEQLAGIG